MNQLLVQKNIKIEKNKMIFILNCLVMLQSQLFALNPISFI